MSNNPSQEATFTRDNYEDDIDDAEWARAVQQVMQAERGIKPTKADLEESFLLMPLTEQRRVLEFFSAGMQSYTSIRSNYLRALSLVMKRYEDGDFEYPNARQLFRQLVSEYFPAAYEAGHRDSSGEAEAEDSEWLKARLHQELGYADTFMTNLRSAVHEGSPMPDIANWVRTLDMVYVQGKARGDGSTKLKFVKIRDTADSCATCRRLEGTTHTARYYATHNYIPAPGANLECGGWQCGHGLLDANDNLYMPLSVDFMAWHGKSLAEFMEAHRELG